MSLDAYVELSRLGPTLTTGEAAAALDVSISQASRTLRTLEARNLGRKVRRGLWIIGSASIDPLQLVEDITRPYPAYVSFTTALNAHGIIDQAPREITVASLDAGKRAKTSFGVYAVRHIPPRLFGGWDERDGVKLARPEKAIFDLAYVAAAHRGRSRRLPELELPVGFDREAITRWIARIESARLRTLTARGVRQLLERAIR